ncbi:PHD finger protein EHD3-like [Aristolochia californica]|uniref:PHD finger protein EHD3-like n=1 Tax=Aristolochia californica TaxID=171875 RepID=UPI0035D9A8F5
MFVDGRSSNGSGAENLPLVVYSSVERHSANGFKGKGVEEVITYKRRKQLKSSVSVGATDPAAEQSTIEPLNNSQKGDVDTLLKNLRHLHQANDSEQNSWMCVLEHLLQSLQPNEDGIKSCIRDVLAQAKETVHANKNSRLKPSCKMTREPQNMVASCNVASDSVRVIIDKSQKFPPSGPSITEKCQRVFLEVIASEKFISLCRLLCENFQGIKAENVLNFSLINSRIQTGEYEKFTRLFATDIQLVWERFKKIGGEMVHLADSLSKASQISYLNQETSQVGSAHKGCMDLVPAKQVPFDGSEQLTKLEQNDACGLIKIGVCGLCGSSATGTESLICDGCEAMYHFSCMKPTVGEIPTRSWYCKVCSANGKDSPLSDWTQNQSEAEPHHDCVVCERLKSSRTPPNGSHSNKEMVTTTLSIKSGENMHYSSKVDRQRGPVRKGGQRMCKRCKSGGNEGMTFLVCRNAHCPHKYYHQSCLRSMEIKAHGTVWYCPSCLCRGCFVDKDDDKIVLCDGCDEAYHTYCMVPPRTSIPKGDWYCIFCNIQIRIRERRLVQNSVKGITAGSMDVLLNAAEKLRSEERSNNR